MDKLTKCTIKEMGIIPFEFLYNFIIGIIQYVVNIPKYIYECIKEFIDSLKDNSFYGR